MLDLVTVPNITLRQKTKLVEFPLNQSVLDLLPQMSEAMIHYDGVGLAAPQVGLGIKIIVINTTSGPKSFLNPTITKSSWRKEIMEEGCLSVPKVFGLVKRSAVAWVEYQDISGQVIKEKMEGFLARVYQHEVDHLNGILFTDKAKEITQGREFLEQYGKF